MRCTVFTGVEMCIKHFPALIVSRRDSLDARASDSGLAWGSEGGQFDSRVRPLEILAYGLGVD